MAETDRVLVVGAGPVGLVAAMALADAGIPVTVIEASPDLPEDLRASTFHPPTLDMLDRFGMAEICIAQGLICPHWQFRDRREGVIATFDLGLLAGETAHPYRVQCEQWKLTRALRDRLAGRFNVDIRYNARALSHVQDDAGVTLAIEEPDGHVVEVRGRYLVGADGARSVVRKNPGVEFPGMTIPELYLTASTSFRFEQAIPDLTEIAYISDPDEWLVLLRTPTLWRVLLPTDAELTDEAITAPETIEARLQEVVPHGGT